MLTGRQSRQSGIVVYTHDTILPRRIRAGRGSQCEVERDTGGMDLTSISAVPSHDPDRFVAVPLLEGQQCNVRVIRLAPGQALPPHTHEPSELMLFVVEGGAVLDTDEGTKPFPAGSLARYTGAEELRVSNAGEAPVTLLAFLTPPFPPR